VQVSAAIFWVRENNQGPKKKKSTGSFSLQKRFKVAYPLTTEPLAKLGLPKLVGNTITRLTIRFMEPEGEEKLGSKMA